MNTTTSPTKIINIQILERSFPVKCPENEVEQLMKAAHYLNTQMRKIRDNSRNTSFERTIVMVALNVCHDLLFHQESTEENTSMDERLHQLQQKVEQAMCHNFIKELDNDLTPTSNSEI